MDTVQGIVEFCQHLNTPAFAAGVAVAFMASKLTIRWLARHLAGLGNDRYEALAWIGVDLAAISLGLSIGGQVWKAASFTPQGVVLWHFGLLLCILLAATMYWGFLKSRAVTKLWLRITCQSGLISASIFLGSSPFLATVVAISGELKL